MSGAIVAASIGAAGSIAGSAISANAAGKAASTQSAAAQRAQQLIQGNEDKATGFQNGVWNQTQSNLNPYIAGGASGESALLNGLGLGGNAQGTEMASGSLLTPYQSFNAPTTMDEQNDPGYQARLKLGTDAIQRSAAARGGVLTGGTGKALDTYAQDYASNEYGNVYNRALQGYQTNANNYYTGQNNQYSRLAGLASSGQNAATAEGQLGQSAANNMSQTYMNSANAQAQQINNAGAATASGYASQGNIWGSGVSGAANNLSNIYGLWNTNKKSTSSGYAPYGSNSD